MGIILLLLAPQLLFSVLLVLSVVLIIRFVNLRKKSGIEKAQLAIRWPFVILIIAMLYIVWKAIPLM